MTTAIEVTKREMYEAIANMKGRITICYSIKDMLCGVDEFEHTLEAHLEELCKARSALVTERDTLRNRVQVLEMANATSGEVIRGLKDEARQARKNFMAARLAEVAASVSVPPYNASGAALDAKTEAILSAVVDCQRIVTNWSLKSIKAKEAMRMIMGSILGPSVNSALDAFEVPETAIEGALKDLMIHGVGAIWMTPSDDGIEVSNRPADEMFKQSGCMHSFHQCYGPRETCTFCGVGK